MLGSANRSGCAPGDRHNFVGFRVARMLTPTGVGASLVREGGRFQIEEDGELPNHEGKKFVGQDASHCKRLNLLGLGLVDEPESTPSHPSHRGGVRVMRVTGSGWESGIRSGDVIVSLNHQAVDNGKTFSEVVKTLPKGVVVPVLLVRGKTLTFFPLTVPE